MVRDHFQTALKFSQRVTAVDCNIATIGSLAFHIPALEDVTESLPPPSVSASNIILVQFEPKVEKLTGHPPAWT